MRVLITKIILHMWTLIPRYKVTLDEMGKEGKVHILSKESSMELTTAISDSFEKSMKEAEKELKKAWITISINYAE